MGSFQEQYRLVEEPKKQTVCKTFHYVLRLDSDYL